MTSADSATPDGKPLPVQDHLPTTFLERGIAVPFTTPQLAGARVRPGDRAAMELIVPNPSGGRGVYILPWESMSGICRPTVHDARLSAMVSTVRGLTPTAIRAAARHIIAQGYAGRRAAAAARAAELAERQAGLIANYNLLLALVRQVEKPGENAIPPERERPTEIERRARRSIAVIAPRLGRSPEAITSALEEIGVLYGSIGLSADNNSSRLGALLARLMRMRQELSGFMATATEDAALQADLAAHAVDLTITCTRAVLADAYAVAADVVELMRQWIADPDRLARLLARPDWLLDGWDRIAAVWEIATGDQRAEQPSAEAAVGALAEICGLLPIVPREAANWVGQHVNIEADMSRHRRKVVLFEDWRTGRSVVDMVARNETAIAEAA